MQYEYRTSLSSTEDVTITVDDSDGSDLSDSSDKEGLGEEIEVNPLSLCEQTSDSQFESLSESSDLEDSSLTLRSVKL